MQPAWGSVWLGALLSGIVVVLALRLGWIHNLLTNLQWDRHEYSPPAAQSLRYRLLGLAPVCLGPAALTAAHVMTVVGLLTFGARAGDYPLTTMGLLAYVLATIAALAGLMALIRRAEPAFAGFRGLLLVSPSAFASLLFWLGFGGGFSPWGTGDREVICFSLVLFAAVFCLVAVLYGSFGYLALAGIMQAALYVGTYALPAYRRYPAGSILRSGPDLFGILVGVYTVGLVLLLFRKVVASQRQPGLWVAAMLPSVTGAWFLSSMPPLLPNDGAYVGYMRTGTYVPQRAWGWTRPVAEVLAAGAAVIAALAAPVTWLWGLVLSRWRVT